MHHLHRLLTVMIAAAFVVLGWGQQGWAQEDAEEDGQSISKFKVPEYDENYKLKSQLFGDFAKFRDDGLVEITNLIIEFYENDEVNMRVTAPFCLYNKGTKEAESESSVRIERDKLIVTGVGFTWKPDGQKFNIKSDAKVVIKEVQRSGGTE